MAIPFPLWLLKRKRLYIEKLSIWRWCVSATCFLLFFLLIVVWASSFCKLLSLLRDILIPKKNIIFSKKRDVQAFGLWLEMCSFTQFWSIWIPLASKQELGFWIRWDCLAMYRLERLGSLRMRASIERIYRGKKHKFLVCWCLGYKSYANDNVPESFCLRRIRPQSLGYHFSLSHATCVVSGGVACNIYLLLFSHQTSYKVESKAPLLLKKERDANYWSNQFCGNHQFSWCFWFM